MSIHVKVHCWRQRNIFCEIWKINKFHETYFSILTDVNMLFTPMKASKHAANQNVQIFQEERLIFLPHRLHTQWPMEWPLAYMPYQEYFIALTLVLDFHRIGNQERQRSSHYVAIAGHLSTPDGSSCQVNPQLTKKQPIMWHFTLCFALFFRFYLFFSGQSVFYPPVYQNWPNFSKKF